MPEQGWYNDPANPGFERFYDGVRWTDRNRVALAPTRSSSRSGGVSSRAIWGVVGLVMLAGIGFFVWLGLSNARALTDQVANVATSAPSAANAATMQSDLNNISVAIQSAAEGAGGTLPSLALTGETYVVTAPSGIQEKVPASPGITSTGLSGTDATSWCAWIGTADGTSMHVTPGGAPTPGPC